MVEALEMSRRKCNELLPESSSKISKEDVAKFILIAIKHGGISNPENGDSDGVKESIRKLFSRERNVDQMYETAKLFSKIFQDECGSKQLYTGNPNATKIVPLRLKRLDPTIVRRFLEVTGERYPERKSCEFITQILGGEGLDSLIGESAARGGGLRSARGAGGR